MSSLSTEASRHEAEPQIYVADGLHQEVEILVDRWGVPHLYAKDDHDLFLAQGFNAARDRLFQLDLWRRRGLGRLAEVLGSDYVAEDEARRLFLYRGDAAAEWAAYGQDAKAIVSAFVEGINAYIGWLEEHREAMPPEFVTLKYAPERWVPEDVTRIRSHGLFYNVEQELARALTVRDLGVEAELIRQARTSSRPLEVPSGLALDALSDAVLRRYRLAVGPVTFDRSGAATAPADGSNNWVIGAERSATGRPIVANDPHRAITLPSLRYVVHLESPGLSAIGGGEPALPGISIGHNGHVAFGLTIWMVDQEDLYVYELNPDDTSQYRYDGQWLDFDTVVERVGVRDAADETVTLQFAKHGPVIFHDEHRGVAVAVRAAWLESGMAPYLGSLRYLRAASANEFVEAVRDWGAPPVNHVYADVAGEFGWQPAAKVPRRRGWDGSFPVPGDGRFEWDGYVAADELPAVRNPGDGWFTSSNESNVAEATAKDGTPLGDDWPSDGRHRRLVEWLAGGRRGIADSAAMQSDDLSVDGLALCSLLRRIDAAATSEPELLAKLQAWDGRLDTSSFEALLFEVWVRRHLRRWLFEDRFAPADREAVKRLRLLATRDESFGSDLRPELALLDFVTSSPIGLERLTSEIGSTLSAAMAEIRELLGDDSSRWRWGALHRAELRAQLSGRLDGAADRAEVLGPLERPGSGDSVGMAGYGRDFVQTLGSTFRVVIDVGQWDDSLAMNSPGQSGHPESKHYADLFSDWAAGKSFPLCYSREAVEANTEQMISLVPRRA